MTAFELSRERLDANEARNSLPRFDPRIDKDLDPHPLYDQYRDNDPINWGLPNDPRFGGMWYLFRHSDCHQLFRMGLDEDSPIGGMPSKLGWDFGAGAPDATKDYFEMRKRFLTAQDPPDHTRVRATVSKWFSAKRVEECRPRIEEVVNEMIDEIEAEGAAGFDFVEKIAAPLPLILISELMGYRSPIETTSTIFRPDSAPGSTSTGHGTRY